MNHYPKLTLLFCSFVLAYVLYAIGMFDVLDAMFAGYGYLSMFIGGLLFSFGFTTPFGIGLFIAGADHVNPFIAAGIGALGALCADFLIFELCRLSLFRHEIHQLTTTRMFLNIRSLFFHRSVSEKLRRYLLWSMAGFVIASPLPDEFGVAMISGLSQLRGRDFAWLCLVFNGLGIFLILLGARAA